MPHGLYTTKTIAEACQVSPRTAAMWIDSGKLKGYRVPGSAHRRVRRADLVRFMRKSGMSDLLANLEPEEVK